MSTLTASFMPAAAPTGAPIELAMQRLWLTGRISAARARLVVQHVFRSAEPKPLEVIYSFLLPRDAAMRSFRISGDGFEAHSELKPTEDAVKAYEEGIAAGSLSTLARQYGDGVVNLTVGNVRPGETVTVYLELLAGVESRDDGFRFRFPFTLAPSYHARMKAAEVAEGEGEIELPSDQFGDMILPRFRKDAAALHEVGFDVAVLHQRPIEEIGSPSHAIRVKQDGMAPAHISLARGRDVPNRDLVLDVQFKQSAAELLLGRGTDGKRSFAAIIPSTMFGEAAAGARRSVIVLDRSGSMQGTAIEQAKKAIEACLAVLAEGDSFGLVAFDNQVDAMEGGLLTASRDNREKARTFLKGIQARGGTELAQGFMEAARMLGGAGDVLILTDGQVSGTEQILMQARAANIRLFCLGIGSASQDRFLSLLSRETGGVSRFVTARERVDLAACDLFASMGRAVASGVKAGSNVRPEPASAVFAGTPLVLFGEGEESSVQITWDGGELHLPLPEGDAETGETVRLLAGARLITDWESRYPSQEALASADKRKASRVASRLVALSQEYGLASREMSLVAVVKRAGDRPGELPETRVVPVGMPQDVNFGAYFGSSMRSGRLLAAQITHLSAPAAPVPAAPVAFAQASMPASGATGLFRQLMPELDAPAFSRQAPTSDDLLIDLASQLETDGGMPGGDESTRAARTVAAVFAFVAEGHSLGNGAFRSHVARLVGFLKSLGGLSDREKELVNRAIQAASSGSPVEGKWLRLARAPNLSWSQIEKAMRQA